jgi:mRNA-degrading endonuclease RelE of RelBE toxin-antitoxin system
LKSTTSKDFRKCLRRLPADVRRQAREAYQLWKSNPRHPSLRFKKLDGGLWSARVGLAWRVLATIEKDEITWFWIGSHAEYDRLIS